MSKQVRRGAGTHYANVSCANYCGRGIVSGQVWRWIAALFSMVLLLWAGGLPVNAQGDAPLPAARIVAVNDQNFPSVSIYVDVFGADGLPVSGLAQSAFAVLEEGTAAQVNTVAVDSSQPLSLLLALDRSTDAQNWAQTQSAANAILDALGPEDQVAITVFFDEVQLVQDFTADKEAARAALAAIEAGGEFSALNPALVDAVSRAAAAPTVRRAVVVVADAPDNISALTTAEALAAIADDGVPVYPVGFGPRVQGAAEFVQLAQLTGGHFFDLATAAQLPVTLGGFAASLKQGYRVDFVSTLPADEQEHNLAVNVTMPDGAVQAGTTMVARLNEVAVSLVGITDGQPVAGVVNLQVQTSGVLPLVSVEYQVDGQTVGAAPDGATPVVWDTATVEPGTHVVRVEAVDSAGNRGEATATVEVIQAGPVLSVLAVDSTSFPLITLFLDAAGANGLPVTGLDATNLAVTEDGTPVPQERITVQPDTSQPMNLVLVLDRSLSTGDWALVRAAANTLIDSLRPQDQLAVYSFAGDVQLEQAATSNFGAIKTDLAALTPDTEPANALYAALLEAVNLAGTLPDGRRAVVVVTDGNDDIGQVSLNQVTAVLANQPVSVHILSFGLNSEDAALMAGLAQLTRGSGVNVGGAAELRPILQQLGQLLPQGYRIGVDSSLRADDRLHTLGLSLVAPGLEASATADFVALSSPITVTIPGVQDGATVSGEVDFTAQATAPAPIVSVEYRLNGNVVATVENTETVIRWPSEAQAPGTYTLEVTVTDRAGNTGNAVVSFRVVAPVTLIATLDAASSDGPVESGSDVTVNAEVEAIASQVRVEVYLNGTLVGADNQPPYSVTFSTVGLSPGRHEITTVAVDNMGREARSTLALPVVAAAVPTATPDPVVNTPAPSVDWGRWLRLGSFGLLGVLILIVLWVLGRGMLGARAPQMTPLRLTLTNLGNVATGYLLRGDDAAGLLSFRFSINGTPLGHPPVARMERTEAASRPSGTPSPLGNRPQLSIPQVNVPQVNVPHVNIPETGGIPRNMDEIGDRVQEATGVGRIITQILVMVAYFFPPSLRRPLLSVAYSIRRGDMMVRRAQMIGKQVQRLNKTTMGRKIVSTAGDAAQTAGRVATSESTREAVATAGRSAGQMVGSAATTAVAGANQAANRMFELQTPGGRGATAGNGTEIMGDGAATEVVTGAGSREWVYVPRLNPGETVTVDVLVGTAKRVVGTQRFPFRILSKPIADENATPLIEEGVIRIAGTSLWRRLWWVLALAIVVLGGVLAYFVLTLVW